jgi:hypothetical protein
LAAGFAGFSLLVGAYLWLAFSSWRRRPAVCLVVFVVLLGGLWLGGAEMLARPKPVQLEWRAPEQTELLAARLFEGEAIYLWLALPETREPRAYVLPWSLEMAKQIARAMADGGQDRGILMERPFRRDRSLEDRSAFHPPPRDKPPDKGSQGTPEIFMRPQ